MTEEEFEDAVAQVRRVLRSGKTFYFWLCPKGSDGEPVLLVDKKQGTLVKRARAARKDAQIKLAAEGSVSADQDGILVFVNSGKLPCKKVSLLFRSELATDEHLKKIAAPLREALILTPEEFEARPSAPGPSARAATATATDDDDDADDADDAELDGEALSAAYDALVATVKPLWSEALAVTGGTGEVHARLLDLRQRAKASKQTDPQASIDLLSQLEMRLWEVLDGPALDEEGEDEADAPVADEDGAAPVADEDDNEDDDAALGEARAALLEALGDAESRWSALDEPEETGDLLRQAVAAFEGDDLEAAQRILDEEIAWRLTRDERVASARETIAEATGGRGVAEAQLALRWRAAVQEARAEVDVFKRRVLADPEVINDPRYDRLAPLVANLSLIPQFGTQLEDALDAVASASGEARARAREDALAVVEDHARTLAADDRLQRVDASDFGTVRVLRALTDALTELKQHLQAV